MPAFLKSKDRDQFKARYEPERINQLAAMQGDEDRVKGSVFANELLQIYKLIRRVIRSEPNVDIYIAAANCLPIHGDKYFFLSMDSQKIITERLPSVPAAQRDSIMSSQEKNLS